MIERYFYKSSIAVFLVSDTERIIGAMASANPFPLETTQRDAWIEQIRLLKQSLADHSGTILFEYSIPRMGKRVDAIVLVGSTVLALEFKVGAERFEGADVDQVWDYAVDLANFHEESHNHRPVAGSSKNDLQQ